MQERHEAGRCQHKHLGTQPMTGKPGPSWCWVAFGRQRRRGSVICVTGEPGRRREEHQPKSLPTFSLASVDETAIPGLEDMVTPKNVHCDYDKTYECRQLFI